MAISESQKGVEVMICINGSPATEYENHLDNTQHLYPEKTVLRYIESMDDVNYTVVNKVHPPYYLKSSLKFEIQVGNVTLPINPLFDASKTLYHTWTEEIRGEEGIDEQGKAWRRPFKFSMINLVDEHSMDRVKHDIRAAQHIQEIRVSVYRVQITEQTYSETRSESNKASLDISEKAIKGRKLAHGTSFGEAVKCRKPIHIFTTRPARGSNGEPVAVFIFRCRSKAELKDEDIVPEHINRQMAREMVGQRPRKKEIKKERVPRNNNGGIKKRIPSARRPRRKYTKDYGIPGPGDERSSQTRKFAIRDD